MSLDLIVVGVCWDNIKYITGQLKVCKRNNIFGILLLFNL